MRVHESDNALIVAYRRIERVRQVRPAVLKFTLSVQRPPGVYTPQITRVSCAREGCRYVD